MSFNKIMDHNKLDIFQRQTFHPKKKPIAKFPVMHKIQKPRTIKKITRSENGSHMFRRAWTGNRGLHPELSLSYMCSWKIQREIRLKVKGGSKRGGNH